MVASRLVDLPDDEDEGTSDLLPEMMFAEGEEPIGVRVLTYQSSRALNNILNALDEEEIQWLRQTSFGKLVDIADKPAFSGRFARFLLSRQLKVEKKHEAWFRFAGKPIRFSLREFAIVTGLPCGELPRKQKVTKKKNLKEKPYWPELFGSVEEIRVSRAVKMLKKKTVTDKEIRKKVACLAIVSSVLLSTNLRMKMLKEHADLLGDLEEFLAYPWGRLAFHMLMTSIKKRDVISLSQNTIALQGFALALQLVIVEAVPSLTEVVQDTCSSSESDTEDEDGDGIGNKSKKQTLSPRHAREVDRKAEALVRSIIPADTSTAGVDALVAWEDDVIDYKVDNLVRVITENHGLRKEMFKGGVTKADVEKMREKGKTSGKKKQPRQKEKTVISDNLDEEKIKNIVLDIVRPEIGRLEGKVVAAIEAVHEVSSRGLEYKETVIGTVEKMCADFKSEIVSFRPKPTTPTAGNGGNSRTCLDDAGNIGVQTDFPSPRNRDVNDEIVDNVLQNISHYSTPPGSTRGCTGGEVESHRGGTNGCDGGNGDGTNINNSTAYTSLHKPPSAKRLSLSISKGTVSESNLKHRKVSSSGFVHCSNLETKSASANSQSNAQTSVKDIVTAAATEEEEMGENHNYTGGDASNLQDVVTVAAGEVAVMREKNKGSAGDACNQKDGSMSTENQFPSFSLGLTQELAAPIGDVVDELSPENTAGKGEEKEEDLGVKAANISCRKSKRMRNVPPLLISDYQCGNSILNRARQVQMYGSNYMDSSNIHAKYERLQVVLKEECYINVAGLSVCGKDIFDIGERRRFLPGRVVDILTRLVATNVNNQLADTAMKTSVFLDTRLHILLSRNYPRFKTSRSKGSYVFTKSVVECVTKSSSYVPHCRRLYFPVNVGRKHWIGVCVQVDSMKLYVFDCNSGVTNEKSILKELQPICEMVPYLLQHCGVDGLEPEKPLTVESVKGVPQNTNPADAALTTCMLIQTHAFFGPESVRNITATGIIGEAERAAVMLYEVHAKL